MTLVEFANSCDKPVVFYTSTAEPTGSHSPLGYPDITIAEDYGLDDLEGSENDNQIWVWNGKGNPRDLRRNSILSVCVFDNDEKWDELVADYESAY